MSFFFLSSSSSNSETQFFSSPEWASLDNELQSNLNLDDIEQFILKSGKPNAHKMTNYNH